MASRWTIFIQTLTKFCALIGMDVTVDDTVFPIDLLFRLSRFIVLHFLERPLLGLYIDKSYSPLCFLIRIAQMASSQSVGFLDGFPTTLLEIILGDCHALKQVDGLLERDSFQVKDF